MKLSSRSLAKLAEAAYHDHTYKAGGTEVLVVDRGPLTVFAFRGTTFDGADIVKDLMAYPWWASEVGTFVHRGFLKGVRAVWSELPIGIPGNKPIVLCGHSKGGAEAILCGAFMVGCGVPPALIETFGAPRVGFNLGKTLKGIPGSRNRLGIDIVPTIPPVIIPSWMSPYRHDQDLTGYKVVDEDLFHNHRIADYVAAMPD